MKSILSFLFLVVSSWMWSQNLVSGNIFSSSGTPAKNVNITLVGTYDGKTTDAEGNFSFETEELGERELELEGEGFASQILLIEIPLKENIEIELEEVTQLETAFFTAGTMRAVGNTNETMMSSLDVVTTADSDGDIIAAMQTLPKFLSNHTHYSPTDPDAKISTKLGKPRQLNYAGQLSVDDTHHVITGACASTAGSKDSSIHKPLYDKIHKKLTENKSYLRRLVKRRSSTVEPVLGTLINHHNMRRG